MYRAAYNSGVYGAFYFYSSAEKALEIPLIMGDNTYPIAPIQKDWAPIPLNMNDVGSYPIMPVQSDPTPIINIAKISRLVNKHTKASTAVNELAEKLPFSRVVNYIVAKNIIVDLFQDNNLENDLDTNAAGQLGGIDDLLASFSSHTLQKLESVGDGLRNKMKGIKGKLGAVGDGLRRKMKGLQEEKESVSNDGKRQYMVGGNWKCNGSMKSVSELADALSRIDTSGVDVVVSPLPIHIPLVQSKLSKSDIIVCSQNVSATAMGAYTGEVAATQLTDMNITTTLIGHSERRKYYGETNDIITQKVKIALANKLNIICCLGETLDERKADKVEEVCFRSLQAISDGVGYNSWDNIVVAYEPVWAIGTGVACSPDKAQQTHQQIRKWFADKVSGDVARKMRIIYGGSVKPKNCEELIAQPDIDGFLVGGAALKPDSFGAIIQSAKTAKSVAKTSKSSQSKRKVVICGGGNAAHIFSALSASDPNNEVHILSLYKTEAADFKQKLEATKDKQLTIEVTQEKRQVCAAPSSVTNDPKCLANADIVIISLPAFAHNQYLTAIKANITPRKNRQTLVAVFPGASGLECEWQSIFGPQVLNSQFALLSCITLPWAARILEFGQKAEILGTKHRVEVCIRCAAADRDDDSKSEESEVKQRYIRMITGLIGPTPKIVDNGHLLNMSLSAINAIVHPPIMYAQWKDYKGKALKKKPLFYQGITKKGAKLLSDLSNEALSITKFVEKETGLTLTTQHIYAWYKSCYGKECSDTSSLRQCILTNPGYNGLTHPCVEDKKSGGYKPNFEYRYLSEDIPYGLVVIKGLSLILDKKYRNKLKTPVMDSIIKWAQKVLGKEYLKYNKKGKCSAGKDIKLSRAPQRYGIKSIKDLV